MVDLRGNDSDRPRYGCDLEGKDSRNSRLFVGEQGRQGTFEGNAIVSSLEMNAR